MKKKIPVSIVIATLGGSTLIDTLKYLNKDNEVPDEIICVIPDEKFIDNEYFLNENIRIIKTNFFGQVQQRIEGFKHVRNEHVLQLDDDILMDIISLKNLSETFLKYGDKIAISPIFISIESRECIYKNNYISKYFNFEHNLINYFVSGTNWGISRMGKIAKSGLNFGVVDEFMKTEYLQVDWLPGGCVMHKKQNLILYDFYPFEGKAYCEDLIHSYHLINRGIKLIVTKNSRCLLSTNDFINNVTPMHKLIPMLFFNKIANKNIYRLAICNNYYTYRQILITSFKKLFYV